MTRVPLNDGALQQPVGSDITLHTPSTPAATDIKRVTTADGLRTRKGTNPRLIRQMRGRSQREAVQDSRLREHRGERKEGGRVDELTDRRSLGGLVCEAGVCLDNATARSGKRALCATYTKFSLQSTSFVPLNASTVRLSPSFRTPAKFNSIAPLQTAAPSVTLEKSGTMKGLRAVEPYAMLSSCPRHRLSGRLTSPTSAPQTPRRFEKVKTGSLDEDKPTDRQS